VAINARHLAGQRRIPLAHLADEANIGQTTLWRILDVNNKGASDPRLSTLGAIAEALGVQLAELVAEPRCEASK